MGAYDMVDPIVAIGPKMFENFAPSIRPFSEKKLLKIRQLYHREAPFLYHRTAPCDRFDLKNSG